MKNNTEEAKAALSRINKAIEWLQNMPEDSDLVSACLVGRARSNRADDITELDTRQVVEWLTPLFVKLIFAQLMTRGFLSMEFSDGADDPRVNLTPEGLMWLTTEAKTQDKAHALVFSMLAPPEVFDPKPQTHAEQ